MRVGISILSREGHNIWSNGIDQNVYHLACLLQSLPFVEKVMLLDCGILRRPPDYAGAFSSNFEVVPLTEIDNGVDVAIEVSGGLDPEWTTRFRARGGKVVYHICGQPYAALLETTVFNRIGFFGKWDRFDEAWILAKDAPFTSMLQATYRSPVYQVPYLWAPVFMDHIVSLIERKDDPKFGYKPGSLSSGHVGPAIFEPNISPIKMGIIPFMICEQMQRVSPATLSRVRFMNSAQFASHPTFISVVGNSDLYKAEKVSLETRDYFAKVMGEGANIVISHQIACPQNYLYLDALYGNYPLIHNSPLFADVGYYYPDSDIEAGYTQLALAIREHDHNLVSYKEKAAVKIAALSPYKRDNQDIYARRLLNLTGGKSLARQRPAR